MKNSDMPASPVRGCDDSFINCDELHGSWIKNCKPSIGLTKREAFAMAAKQGLLASGGGASGNPDQLAVMAIQQAGIILEELDKF